MAIIGPVQSGPEGPPFTTSVWTLVSVNASIFYIPQFHAFIDNFNFFLDIVATNGDWSTEDTIWFSERVVNSQFVTKILDVIYDPLDDNVRISVSLIDTTHPTTDIYIEKQLVEDKRAVYLCV